MGETLQIIFGLAVLAGVYMLTRYGVGRRMRKTAEFIVNDLRSKNALDAHSAVHLPYEKKNMLHLGLRDYRPQALSALVAGGLVKQCERGYFLALEAQETEEQQYRSENTET